MINFVESRVSFLPDSVVMKKCMTAEFIRRPHLWTLPYTVLYRTLDNGLLQHGYVLLPYTQREPHPMVQGDSTTIPIALCTIPSELLLGEKCDSDLCDRMQLLAFFHEQRKMIYQTPEDIVEDGWKMTPFITEEEFTGSTL